MTAHVDTATRIYCEWSNWFCRKFLFFPKSICDKDRCLYHDESRPQTVTELACTTLIHFSSCFALVTAADYLITRPLTWFLQRTIKPIYQEVKRDQLLAAAASASATSPTTSSSKNETNVMEDTIASPISTSHNTVSNQADFEKSLEVDDNVLPEFSGILGKLKSAVAHVYFAWGAKTRKTSWFLLHVLFNSMVAAVSWEDTKLMLKDPVNNAFSTLNWAGTAPSGLLCAIMIFTFHFHHILFYVDFLTKEDIVHHTVSAGAVVVAGVLLPFGRQSCFSNAFMCGLPGGSGYVALFLNKLGLISRYHYKYFNRYMNLLVRFPGQYFVHYIGTVLLLTGKHPKVSPILRALAFLAGSAHTFNAIYYCDITVGTYHLEVDVMKRAKTLEKERAAAEKK